MEAVKKFLDKTPDDVSASALDRNLRSSLQDLGLGLFAYLAIRMPGQLVLERAPLIVSNYPRKWIERYVQQNYQLRDPIVGMTSVRRTPLHWDARSWGWPLRPDQRQMLEEALEFGIARGVTFPIHGPGSELGLFTIASAEIAGMFEDAVRENLHIVHMIGLYTHNIVAKQFCWETQAADFGLTPKEKEVLLWTARGKTSWEAARIIHRSEATVNYHLKQAMRKLNAANKCQAVAKATLHHLLDF